MTVQMHLCFHPQLMKIVQEGVLNVEQGPPFPDHLPFVLPAACSSTSYIQRQTDTQSSETA